MKRRNKTRYERGKGRKERLSEGSGWRDGREIKKRAKEEGENEKRKVKKRSGAGCRREIEEERKKSRPLWEV